MLQSYVWFIFGFTAGVGFSFVFFILLKKSFFRQEQMLEANMKNQFENLAQKIFEEKNQSFSQQNLQNLNQILNPLKERIKDFEKKVEDTYSSERSDRGVLRGEIGKLIELHQNMSLETKNLTQALKGDQKIQGNWGEFLLESILERSGLRKNDEYIVQGTDLGLKNSEGQTQKPDVVVILPDNKHLVVDSKMSLNAYANYVSSESDAEKDKLAKLHVDSLKKHIDDLSSKKYQLNEKLSTPEFVILFMPLEPAFALACRIKPELFQYAWDKNVAIVSPTTLLTTLKTVATLWRQDRQEKNALEIAKRGGLLYDKFVGLIKDLQSVGEKLSQTQKVYDETWKKVSDGRGNLIDQVEDLKRLGAKTEKSLPIALISTDANEELGSSNFNK
ncbi:MAG: DNA recombination protein RmuC [Pseudobdellovibrionaceae bacterium]